MNGVSLRFAWRLAVRDSALPSSAKLVAHTLATYLHDDGGGAYPSLATLAHGSGLSRTTVVAALRALEFGGWITRTQGGGRHKTTRYRAQLPPGSVRHLNSLRIKTVHRARRNGSLTGHEDVIREDVLVKTECMKCGVVKACRDDGENIWCLDCLESPC